MSCCPGIKCKNTGSGYTKPSNGAASEIDKRMKDLLAARAADDARIWTQPTKSEPQTVFPVNAQSLSAKPSNTLTYS